MKKELTPEVLSDQYYWKYVHGSKPDDLEAWLREEHGKSEEEAREIVEKVAEIEQQNKERLQNIKGRFIAAEESSARKDFEGGWQ